MNLSAPTWLRLTSVWMLVLIAVTAALSDSRAQAEPWINEFLAENRAGLADDDGAFSDWLELHNPGPVAANLAGWRLTDDPVATAKWVFPSVTIPAGGYLVVFASGKNRAVAGLPLHTSFALAKGGEYLALVRPDGTLAQEFAPSYPAQVEDRSYGVSGAGLFYFNVPTPGAANGTPSFAGVVANTQFSHQRGIYTNAFALAISCATPGATIRYTLNGSAPTATTGTIYSGPIPIAQTTVLRAAAFLANSLPSNVDTHTYLFLADVIRQSANGAAPAGWPSGTPNGQRMDYGMDPRIVDHVDPALGGAAQVIAALTALPTVSVTLRQSDLTGTAAGIYVNATQRGIDWERVASIELLNDAANGGGGFQSECGLRIRGNWSRQGDNPKHSFRVFFRDAYGDSKLNYPLFGDAGANEFDAFDLQTPQDASWAFADSYLCNYLRDTWSRVTLGDLGQPTARSRWVHLYLNGIYWGIFQIEERPEASFGETYLGGAKEEYDVIKATGLEGGYTIEATDGYLTGPGSEISAWQSLFNQTRSHFAAPSESKYFALQGLGPDGVTPNGQPRLLEVDNFADYLLMVMHSANTDMLSSYWIGFQPNNFYCIRRRGGNLGFISVAHDGETSMDRYGNDYDRTGPVNDAGLRGNFDYSNPEFFHDDLLPSLEYRVRFGDRAHRALFNAGALSPEASVARLDRLAAELAPAIIAESARWGDAQSASDPYTKADWLQVKNQTRGWFDGRREHLLSPLRADGLYPDVTAPTFSQHGGELPATHGLTMAGAGGPVFYTLDGSDPRLVGGGLRPGALSYTGGVSTVTELIPAGATWRFRDLGTDEGTAWRTPNFNDANWSQGPAPLGYGDGDEATTVNDNVAPGYNAADTDRFITTYFRRAFALADASGISTLTLELQRDDGAIVYLNGQEVARSNLPGGVVNFQTPATTSATGADESNFLTFDVSPGLLLNGANVVAVEMHQSGADSSDISFDLRLTATRTTGAQPLTLPPGLLRLNARARAANGEWSALTSADFLVAAVFADASNLVVSEIMFHPPDADAEFVELMNVGAQPVDLRGVQLAGAVNFVFPSTQGLLPAGGRVVLARNVAAFLASHPGGPVPAGEFSGSFDNGGETLRLRSATGELLWEFHFDDDPPWPGGTAGTGRSLVLVRPERQPSPANPLSWRPSALIGGSPGESDAVNFSDWAQQFGVNGSLGDGDGDGLVNLFEYAFGLAPVFPDAPQWHVEIERGPLGEPLALRIIARHALAADDAKLTFLASGDLQQWQPLDITRVGTQPVTDQVAESTWRLPWPLHAAPVFLRLGAAAAP